MYICILMFVNIINIINGVTKGTAVLLLYFLLKTSINYVYLQNKVLIDCVLFDIYYKRYYPLVEQLRPFFETLSAFVQEMNGNYMEVEDTSFSMEEIGDKAESPVKPLKYEDKYLDKIRSLPEEYIFSKEEEILEAKLFVTYSEEDGSSIESFETQMKHKKTHCAEQVEIIKKKLIELNDKQITETEIKELVNTTLLNARLDKLKNNFLIETTPLGNVLMFYNNKKETFEYYSDSTIPYRVLEVVCRKYVLTYNCRFLYIDMEQELKKY